MTVLTVLSTFFAAVAAWGAVMTVQLTTRMRRDGARKMIIEALISIKYAAKSAAEVSPNLRSSELNERFRDAQRDLERAWITAPLGVVPSDDEISEPLGSLLRALPRSPDEFEKEFEVTKPEQAGEMAQEVLALLSREYVEKPTLQEQLMTRLYYLRHPRPRRGMGLAPKSNGIGANTVSEK